jgi:MFS family permease
VVYEQGEGMSHLRRAYLASMVGLVGGAVQIVYGLLAIVFSYGERLYGWDEALWAVANLGMIGGVLSLLFLDIARPRWLAQLGAALSVLGQLLRIVVSALLIVAPAQADSYVPFLLCSILLMVLGLLVLGVATLLGRQLRGWQAWLPLLIAGCVFGIMPTYDSNRYLHFILLGLWGIPWLLLSYAVRTHLAHQQPATPSQLSRAGS